MTSKVLIEDRDDVRLITINRAEVRNSLDRETRLALAAAITEGQTMRAIALTGAGPNFCSGQDLAEGQKLMAAGGINAKAMLDDEYEPILYAIDRSAVPLIALVHGNAVGAGLSLALACDLVLAAETTYFQMGFGKIALSPDVGLSYILPRLIGTSRAMGMALENAKIEAPMAQEWGMVWQILPDDNFIDQAMTVVERISKNSRGSNAAMRDLIRHSQERDYRAQLDAEADFQTERMRHPDFIEGAMAFMQKRPAKFE